MNELAAKRPLIPAAFSFAVVLFFFTFCEFKCQGRKVDSATGFNLVMGKELKQQDDFTGQFNNQKKSSKLPANMWAILALIAGVVGAGVFLKKDKNEDLIGTAAGAIGFISLLILQFTLKSKMSNESGGQVETSFQFPYWLALIAFGVAGFISYLRKQNAKPVSAVPKTEVLNEPLKKDDIVGG